MYTSISNFVSLISHLEPVIPHTCQFPQRPGGKGWLIIRKLYRYVSLIYNLVTGRIMVAQTLIQTATTATRAPPVYQANLTPVLSCYSKSHSPTHGCQAGNDTRQRMQAKAIDRREIVERLEKPTYRPGDFFRNARFQ